MTFREVYPGIALVVILACWFVVHARQRRQLAEATRLATADMHGRFEPGGHLSGGTIYGRVEGRDVVVMFFLGSSRQPPRTTAVAIMSRRPEREGLRRRLTGAWQGTRFGERLMARLEAARVRRVTLHSNNLSVEVARVLRGRGSILELASIAAAAAAEAECGLAPGCARR